VRSDTRGPIWEDPLVACVSIVDGLAVNVSHVFVLLLALRAVLRRVLLLSSSRTRGIGRTLRTARLLRRRLTRLRQEQRCLLRRRPWWVVWRRRAAQRRQRVGAVREPREGAEKGWQIASISSICTHDTRRVQARRRGTGVRPKNPTAARSRGAQPYSPIAIQSCSPTCLHCYSPVALQP
jgi:hypothetical protein